MSETGLFALHGEDAVHHLGIVYSISASTLRTFGAANMRDPKTIGSLKLLDETGHLVARFDVWTDDWKECVGHATRSSNESKEMVG